MTKTWNADTIVKKSTAPPSRVEPDAAPAPEVADNTKLQAAAEASGAFKTPPLTEGKVVKGGRNQGPSQVKERPPAAQAVNPVRMMVRMAYKKSTPGTHVFMSVDPDAPIPSLYIRKAGLPNGIPKGEIEVTIR